MPKFTGSLTTRVFLLTALLLTSACALTYVFMVWATPITVTSIQDRLLEQRTDQLAEALSHATVEDSDSLLTRFMIDTGATATLVDADGVPVSEESAGEASPSSEEAMPAPDPKAEQDGSIDVSNATFITQAISIDDEDAYRTESTLSIPVTLRNSDQPYRLDIQSGAAVVNQTRQALAKVWPYLALLVLTVSTLGALFYSRHITGPIVRLSGISQRMADLNFTSRYEEKRTDEIGLLGRNLDSLSERLSAALGELQQSNSALRQELDRKQRLAQQRTSFFSAASHELKTPLTILKGQLSGMLAGVDIYQDRDKYLLRSLAVTNRMEGLVSEMLAISRLDNPDMMLRREPVDLSALLSAQIEQAEELAEQKEQTLSAEVTPGLMCSGDAVMLSRALGNLLTNAILYSPERAVLSVMLRAYGDGAVLTIRNAPASIPDEALPHLFDAFYRVESSRNRASGGSGLGLYIVKMILDRHGASCDIRSSEEAVEVTATFPPPLHTNSI